MNEAPRYSTLRDYLRVIRAQRWLLLAVVAVFAGVAYAVSATQDKTYEASATLALHDLGQDLNLLGTTAPPQSTAEQLAAENAQLINRPSIAVKASKRLDGRPPADEIQANVAAEVGGPSNLVLVHARSADPQLAADVANAVALEVSKAARQAEERRITRAIESLRKELRSSSAGDRRAVSELGDQIAQLETVKTIAQPVKVAEVAQVPGGPISPKPLRSTFLAALLGLAVGLLVVFVRDALDRRLRSAHEVHDELGLPVLGRVSNTAMGSSGFVQNGHPGTEEADLEAFRMLRTNLEFLNSDEPVRMILVTSGLPEEGKSTVAAGLASAAAIAGKRALLVECDLRRPSLAERLGLQREPGLSEYLIGEASPQDVLQTASISDASANGGPAPAAGKAAELLCITAGRSTPRPAELLSSERCRAFLEDVRGAYDIVVLDTSPLLSVVDALALVPHVDGVIVCVRAAQTTRDEARAAKAALDHLPPRSMGAVVTGIRPQDDETYEYYYAYGR